MSSFDKDSIEIFFVSFGLIVEMICCMLNQFFRATLTENIAVRLRILFFSGNLDNIFTCAYGL